MTTDHWNTLEFDYTTPNRHRMPRVGDLVRLAGGAADWRWHAIVDGLETEADSASPGGVSVVLLLRPARVLSPLHGQWAEQWAGDPTRAVPIADGLIAAAEHAVEVCVVNYCRRDATWTSYRTHGDPFPYVRA